MPALQHGFTVEPTEDVNLNRLQQRVKLALDKLAALATVSQLADKGCFILVGAQNLQNQKRGADVVAGSAIATRQGYQHLTGATAVNYINISDWFDGARVDLFIVNGLTFNHNAGAPPAGAYALQMLSGANTAKAANSVISFRRDDALKRWLQVQ
jgi:hypothetical protein